MGLWANMVHVKPRLFGVSALTSLSFKLRYEGIYRHRRMLFGTWLNKRTGYEVSVKYIKPLDNIDEVTITWFGFILAVGI